MKDLTKERQLNLLKEISKCRSIDNNCDYLLEHSDCDDLIDYITDLEQENQELKEHCEKQRYAIIENCDLRKKILKLEDVLDEIREYINKNKYFYSGLQNEDREIGLFENEINDLLQILDKANEQKW